MKFEEMDPRVSVQEQLDERGGPVVLLNVFTVEPAEADALLEAWASDSKVMAGQPGYISAQMHRGISGSGVFMNYAVWESVNAFRTAFTHPDFRAQWAKYPPSTVTSPHLLRKIAVPGICVA